LKQILTSASDTPNWKAENIQSIGANFELLRQALPRMIRSSAASVDELREHYERLAKAMGKIDRRVGRSDGFGMMASVTTTFDGLHYLHEVGEERNEKFVKYPYEQIVKDLAKMDQAIATLQTIDRWTDEVTSLRQLNEKLACSVHDLKEKTIASLVNFYRRFTSPGSPTPGDLLTSEMSRLNTAVAQLEAGGRSQPHTQVGFDYFGNQVGSTSQVDNILA
jgi:hypothetical protein